jgi:hypothetical protein
VILGRTYVIASFSLHVLLEIIWPMLTLRLLFEFIFNLFLLSSLWSKISVPFEMIVSFVICICKWVDMWRKLYLNCVSFKTYRLLFYWRNIYRCSVKQLLSLWVPELNFQSYFFIAVTMVVATLWDLTPCSLIEVYRCFEEHTASIIRVEL